jgi:hypothetical protein
MNKKKSTGKLQNANGTHAIVAICKCRRRVGLESAPYLRHAPTGTGIEMDEAVLEARER